MEEQERALQPEEQEDVQAHIRPGRQLQDEGESTDEHGRRARSDDDDDDVEAHIRKA